MPRRPGRCSLTLAAALAALGLASLAAAQNPRPGTKPHPYAAPLIPEDLEWGGAITERFTDPAWQAMAPVLDDWDVRGTRSVRNGVLRLGDPGHARENNSIMSKKPYMDFTLEVEARLTSDPKSWGGLGLWFRAAEPRGLYRNDDLAPGGTSGYAFDYSPGRKSLTLVRRPHTLSLARQVPMVADNNWHRFRVEAVGNQYTCYLDGKLVFRASDPSPKGPYWWGYVGMGVMNKGTAEVRSIRITPR